VGKEGGFLVGVLEGDSAHLVDGAARGETLDEHFGLQHTLGVVGSFEIGLVH